MSRMTPDELIEAIQKMCSGAVPHVVITDADENEYWPVRLSFSRIGIKGEPPYEWDNDSMNALILSPDVPPSE